MDILQLKNELYKNPNNIVKILEYYGYEKITLGKNEIRCARDNYGNSSSIRIKLNENVTATDFAKNVSGDIISLFMNHKSLSFPQVLDDMKRVLNLGDLEEVYTVAPFGGMFENVRYNIKSHTTDMKVYDEDILQNYNHCWSVMFAKDNISPKVQKDFQIGYDPNTNRISVPWRTIEGKLCGIMGRLNKDKLTENDVKWFPIIPFSKSNTLYGFSENYNHILESNDIIIGESEKHTLQMATYGYRNGVSLGGNNLGEQQIKYILSTNPKRIILSFDEGLDLDVVARNVDNMKPFLKMKETDVYMIMDLHNKYMPKESKCSATDMGKQTFENILKECLIKVY